MSSKIDSDKSSLTREWLYSIYSDKETKHIWSMVVAGGGNGSLKEVFNQPGASASLRSALIPYSLDSFPTYTNNKQINGCVNKDTSNILGQTAYRKTIESLLREEALIKEKHNISDILNSNIFSIACTATLRSLTPKRGDHRFIVSSVSNIDTFIYEFTIDKTEDLSRVQEDDLTSDAIFLAIGNRCKIPYDLMSDNKLNKTILIHDDPFKNLYDGKTKKVLCFLKEINGSTFNDRFNCFEDINLPEDTLVFPGTFNPIHNGHIELAKIALIKLGWDITKPNSLIVFDIGCYNADKGFKSIDEIKKIIDQNIIILKDSGITNFAFSVSSESLYSNKSYLYKNCYLLQGADTFERVLDTKYYENSEFKLISSLTEIYMNGCKFIIGGRLSYPSDPTILTSYKKFITASSIINEKGKNIPIKILETYIQLSEEDFRIDLSSTEIKLIII